MVRFCWAALLLFLLATPAAAQSLATKDAGAAPRTPWGDPDLQGVYTNIEQQRVPVERWWEGNTLVVETRNFKGVFSVTSAAGKELRIVERFTPTRSGSIEWAVTIDDASGWTRPWTLAMPLARADDTQGPLENACHEGNYVLRNILSAARAEERAETK